MSDTPRTDEFERLAFKLEGFNGWGDFARHLEREIVTAGCRAAQWRDVATAPPSGAHTPEPWECRLARLIPGAEIFGFSIHAQGKRHSIAAAGVYEHEALILGADYRTSSISDQFYSPAEVEANARLIAAAPVLLQALRDLLNKSHAEGWIYSAEEREAAALAIEKATGQPVETQSGS